MAAMSHDVGLALEEGVCDTCDTNVVADNSRQEGHACVKMLCDNTSEFLLLLIPEFVGIQKFGNEAEE